MKETAGECSRFSLNFMVKHKIPVTPPNYYVCYEYFSGENQELNEVMNRIVDTRGEFSENLLNDLYQNFIAEYHCAANNEITREIREILENLIGGMSNTEGDVFSKSRNLKTFADNLKRERGIDKIKSIARIISSTAADLAAAGENMHNRLKQATGEIEALKKQLGQTRKQSITDPLTGLINRRGMEWFLKRNMATAKKSGENLCIMMADIDHFKKINDTHGHLVGDNTLKIIASTLNNFIQEKESVIRYGGEEFLVILKSKSLREALGLAEKIRKSLASISWKEKNSGKSIGQITLSFGIAQMRPDDSMTTFITRADQALYHSKQTGRNKVSLEDQVGTDAIDLRDSTIRDSAIIKSTRSRSISRSQTF